jgi:hypothetical protein
MPEHDRHYPDTAYHPARRPTPGYDPAPASPKGFTPSEQQPKPEENWEDPDAGTGQIFRK